MKDTLSKKDIRQTTPVRKRIALSFVAALGAAAVLAGPQMRTAGAQDFQTSTSPTSAKPTAVRTSAVSTRTTAAVRTSAVGTRTSAVSPKISEPPASPAAEPDAAAAPKPERSRLAGRYFVDFRARTAASYGHAFVWYGRLNEHGKVGKIEVAGLHPASDSALPYILGHIIPVPAETGKSYGDLDEQYLTANYRVYLNEADARRVFAYIQHKQASSPLWWNGVYNCTAFIADIAAYMGLQTPPTSTWMYPETMVNALRDVNHGRQEAVLAATAH
jgi:hypothetical protein